MIKFLFKSNGLPTNVVSRAFSKSKTRICTQCGEKILIGYEDHKRVKAGVFHIGCLQIYKYLNRNDN